jgi:hypothetical protein
MEESPMRNFIRHRPETYFQVGALDRGGILNIRSGLPYVQTRRFLLRLTTS